MAQIQQKQRMWPVWEILASYEDVLQIVLSAEVHQHQKELLLSAGSLFRVAGLADADGLQMQQC